MADGYQLDYKKVHNTLGKPKKDKYGEEVGQYNLWTTTSASGSYYATSGTIIQEIEDELPIHTWIRISGPTVTDSWIGCYVIINCTEAAKYFCRKIVSRDGDIIKLDKPIWNINDNTSCYVRRCSSFISCNNSYITIESTETIEYQLLGWCEKEQKYIIFNNAANHRGSDSKKYIIHLPRIGYFNTYISPVDYCERVNQWYIAFFYQTNVSAETKAITFFESSIPLTEDMDGLVTSHTVKDDIIQPAEVARNMYSDGEAWDIIRTAKPRLVTSEAPYKLYAPDEMKDVKFLNWMEYHDYLLQPVLVRVHWNKTSHTYQYKNIKFEQESYCTILRTVDFEYNNYQYTVVVPAISQMTSWDIKIEHPVSIYTSEPGYDAEQAYADLQDIEGETNPHKKTMSYLYYSRCGQLCKNGAIGHEGRQWVTLGIALYPMTKNEYLVPVFNGNRIPSVRYGQPSIPQDPEYYSDAIYSVISIYSSTTDPE